MATSPVTDRPLRADARRNRERVLAAAVHCFSRDGLKAQMDDVAERAKVGVGTVYRHFPTKDALIEALADDYFERQNEAARAALEVEDPWEAFSGYVRRGSDILGENVAVAEVLSTQPEMMAAAAHRAAEHLGFFDTLETVIDRAKASGELRADFRLEDIPLVMCSLGAVQRGPKTYATWRRLREIVVDGLRAPGHGTLPDEPAPSMRARTRAQR